jgi:hypothetical protein
MNNKGKEKKDIEGFVKAQNKRKVGCKGIKHPGKREIKYDINSHILADKEDIESNQEGE